MVAQVFHANLLDLDSTPQVTLGAIYELDNARYKYVQFSGTTAIAAGSIVCYVVAASDGNEVIVDGANSAFGAGVAVNAVGTGAVLYGWVQVTGRAPLTVTPAGTPTFGQNLTTVGGTAGNVTVVAVNTAQVVGYYYGVVNTLSVIIADFPN